MSPSPPGMLRGWGAVPGLRRIGCSGGSRAGGGGGLRLARGPAGFAADAGTRAEDNGHSRNLKHRQLFTKNLMPVVGTFKQHLEQKFQ